MEAFQHTTSTLIGLMMMMMMVDDHVIWRCRFLSVTSLIWTNERM